MNAGELERVLRRKPLSYRTERRKGSHKKLVSPGRQPILYSFHKSVTVPPGLVRKILVVEAGLSEEAALALIGSSKGGR